MLDQEQPRSLVSTTMQQPNTSRPATKEERNHVTDFLQREYFQSIYKHGVNTVDWLNLHHNDDPQERHVERDFTYIATIVDESDIHTYPDFFPDADKIEVRVWPINFLNTFQQFKQFPDGRLERHLPAVKMKTDKPPAITQLKSALNEKIATSNEDSWICLCGNNAEDDGFYPCDAQGNSVEPTPELWTTECYVCEACGRIIHRHTLQVVGQRRGQPQAT